MRYRQMSRRLAELDRLDRGAQRGRKRRLGRANLIFIGCALAVLGLVYGLGRAFPSLLTGIPGPWSVGDSAREPSPTGTGPHAFLMTTPTGRPVGYDPCRPIHYVLNPSGQPDAAANLVQDAVHQVAAASGFTFADDGVTQQRPDLSGDGGGPRSPRQNAQPVLIAWADRAEFPRVRGDIEGIGGSTSLEPAGPESARYVTGQVVLNRDGLAELLNRRDGYVRARAIVMHELGHLVGLDHVNAPGELMAPNYTGLAGFGPGDREGLARLRASPCW